MAEKGSSINISAVVRVIVSKLTRKEKNEDAIEVLEHIRELSRTDKRKIEGSIDDLNNDELTERAKKVIEKL